MLPPAHGGQAGGSVLKQKRVWWCAQPLPHVATHQAERYGRAHTRQVSQAARISAGVAASQLGLPVGEPIARYINHHTLNPSGSTLPAPSHPLSLSFRRPKSRSGARRTSQACCAPI